MTVYSASKSGRALAHISESVLEWFGEDSRQHLCTWNSHNQASGVTLLSRDFFFLWLLCEIKDHRHHYKAMILLFNKPIGNMVKLFYRFCTTEWPCWCFRVMMPPIEGICNIRGFRVTVLRVVCKLYIKRPNDILNEENCENNKGKPQFKSFDMYKYGSTWTNEIFFFSVKWEWTIHTLQKSKQIKHRTSKQAAVQI